MKNIRQEIRHFKQLESKLGYGILTYKPGPILLRFLAAIGFAVLLIFLIAAVSGSHEIILKSRMVDYIRVSIAFIFVSEAQILVDKVLEYYMPIPFKMRSRIAVQTLLGIIGIILAYRGLMLFSHDYEAIPPQILIMGVSFALVFVTQLTGILIIFRLTEKWILFQEEMEKLKREKLKSDYNSLQDQLNPHFLFNNLSVLKSLILYNTNSALKFTDDFTDVYRYVLDSKSKTLVTLREELDFIKAYIGLHQERLGEGLKINVQIAPKYLDDKIAPLTLQLLIENAIKHNIAQSESPLSIQVLINDNKLIVQNNVQLKATSYSTHTGLKNLSKRYEMISEKTISIFESKGDFIVQVPLL